MFTMVLSNEEKKLFERPDGRGMRIAWLVGITDLGRTLDGHAKKHLPKEFVLGGVLRRSVLEKPFSVSVDCAVQVEGTGGQGRAVRMEPN